MKHITHILIVAVVLSLTGCSMAKRRHQAGAAVEMNGQYLYYSTLDSLTIGLSGEDSARVADLYIQQWAKDILEYQKARDNADNAIEALVEDYRRSLYVHNYEQNLIDKRMSKQVADSVIERIYTDHQQEYLLQEGLLKGMLIVVPKDAPNLQKLKQWMTNLNEKNLEEIEKYAFHYASGYELFNDRWVSEQEMVLQMPFESNQLSQMLHQRSQIELSDSLTTWILQVTERRQRGETMPLEHARPEIEKAILSRRQVDFLQQEREKLYEQAILFQKIKFYEKD